MLSFRGGGLWRQPDFLRVWIGSSISAVGSQITVLAVPLTAVLMFGAGPAETGVLTAAGVAPNMLISLVAGAWVDRAPRLRVRMVSDLLSACVVCAVPVASVLNVLRLEHLYVTTFLVGTLTVCSRLASSALMPDLIGRENLVDANSKLLTTFSLAQILGPSLAGLLLRVMTPAAVLFLDAISFVVSAVCFWQVRQPESKTAPRSALNFGSDILEGFRWLRSQPVLLRLTIAVGLANVAWYGVQAVMVVFATRDLELSPGLLGLALGAIGPTSLVGALIAGRCARRFGLGPTMVGALCGELLSRVLLLVADGPPLRAVLVIATSQAVFGFIAPLWDVNASSLRQSATPHQLLGRVSAVSYFFGSGLAPIGALLAGWLGEAVGVRASLVGMALVTAAAVLVLVWSPIPRLRGPMPAQVGEQV